MNIIRLRLLLLLLVACSPSPGVVLCAAEMSREAQLEFFETRIRPVLIDQCYECHNSAKKAEGSLTVDDRHGLLKGGDSGPAVVPGNSKESLLIQVLRHELDGMQMPKSAPKLSDSVIADFEKWVQLGAADPRDQPPTADDLAKATSWENQLQKRKQWWSFQPIREPSVPYVKDTTWPRGDIDQFLLSRMEQSGLTPSADAESGVLIRRLFFVLTGLPPTANDLATWTPLLSQSDRMKRDAAYRQLVDELLARPQFGEHWARHWMDWIRYAESHGSEGDPDIGDAWRYRDYLIRAMNADVPYDQLVREHIAGDLLEKPRLNHELQINESLIGPAHWRMVFHGFTPTDALDEKVRFIDDEINVCSKAFLGLTVSCARCHNHKFDAISQADYYALFGILGSCRPGRNIIDLPAVQEKNVTELAAIKTQLRQELSQAWIDNLNTVSPEWFSQPPIDPKAKPVSFLEPWQKLNQQVAEGVEFNKAWDQIVQSLQNEQKLATDFQNLPRLQSWKLSQPEQSQAWFKSGQGVIDSSSSAGSFTVALAEEQILTDIFPAGIYSHLHSSKHPARISSPDIDLQGDYEVWMNVCGDGGAIARYVVQHYPRSGTVFQTAKLTPEWQWVKLNLSYWKGDNVFLELVTSADAPIPSNPQQRSWLGLREAVIVPAGSPSPGSRLPPGMPAILQVIAAKPVHSQEELQAAITLAVSKAVEGWQTGNATDDQAELLDACLKQGLLPNTFKELPNLRPLVESYRKLEAEIPIPTRVPGLDEAEGHDQPLYVRGDHKQPSDLVPRRFLEAVDATPYRTSLSGRRQLAEDLVRDDNPLTRRVIVNRVWHHVFSQGLVRTPDNLGKMGELPTHPELLDWLATRFPQQGWSFKTLIRELVLSHAWQLASTPSAESVQLDPDNRLLSHAHVRRLEAESIRDSVLMATGQLDQTQFGTPVDGRSRRRSVYVAVRRNSLDPFLREFDFPEPFSTTGRRDVTNVPAQALTMMNDSRFAVAAAAWSKELLQAGRFADDNARIEAMFVSTLGRPATDEEVQLSRQYLDRSRQQRRDLEQQRIHLQAEITKRSDSIGQLLEAAARRVDVTTTAVAPHLTPRPIARWDFEKDAQDSIGSAHATQVATARVLGGAAVTGSKGHFVSQPLDITLKEKTLEAWVQLDTLDQRGGGVISVQSHDGQIFDSIVFGEMNPGQWMAGSDFGRRTKQFQGPLETDAANRPVHLAISYHSDGTIVGFRNGTPYGSPYKADDVAEFPAGKSVVTIGLRHLPAGGNRYLSGRVLKAQLYDRALSPDEVQASFQSDPAVITDAQLMKRFSPEEWQELISSRKQLDALRSRLKSLPEPVGDGHQAEWADLARGLFLFKEFLYLK